jgi:hypothetical protein
VGHPAAIENFWECGYSIALVPFVLGVPSSQVELFLADGFCGLGVAQIDGIVAGIFMDTDGVVSFLPDGCKGYFMEVYARANSEVAVIARLPPRSIRIMSGYGYGNYDGGNLVCGEKKVSFLEVGANATVVTIL